MDDSVKKALAVCAGGAGIGFALSGGNPLGAIGGCVVAAMATGCVEPVEFNETSDSCFVPETGEPIVEADKIIHTSGQNYIVSDAEIGQEQADRYLEKIPVFTHNILNLFAIDSPWKDRIVLNLLNEENFVKHCPKESGGCAGRGRIFLRMPPIEDRLLYHELSHALRSNVMQPWWGLEEGLAVYTEFYAQEAVFDPDTQKAVKIFDEVISLDQTIRLQDENLFRRLKEFKISPLTDTKMVMTYSFRRPLHDEGLITDATMEISVDQYFLLYFDDLIVRIERDGPTQARLVFLKAEQTQDGRLNMNFGRHCTEEGIKHFGRVMTSDGPIDIVINGEAAAYAKLDTVLRDGVHGEYYQTGFCFWSGVREQYDHEIVQTMVQAMAAFSKENKTYRAPFPFFATFIAVTGMGVEEAGDYFKKFSAPIENDSYMLGSVCW